MVKPNLTSKINLNVSLSCPQYPQFIHSSVSQSGQLSAWRHFPNSQTQPWQTEGTASPSPLSGNKCLDFIISDVFFILNECVFLAYRKARGLWRAFVNQRREFMVLALMQSHCVCDAVLLSSIMCINIHE